jgi:cardiolipin synthase
VKIFWRINQRALIYALALLIQLILLIGTIVLFQNRFYLFYVFSIILSVGVVIWILQDASYPTYKLAWIIPILVLPVFGGLLYLFFGRKRLMSKMRHALALVAEKVPLVLQQDREVLDALEQESPDAARQASYLAQRMKKPVFIHTESKFLPTGEVKFSRMMKELEKAERYIFLEYFIIDEGFMWGSILGLLKEKVRQGVDVRVIYDDAGCISKLPAGYDRYLEKMGIRCAVFNPMRPVIGAQFNSRDHRKIAVVDGLVGYTGGINLADEYINEIERFGHWKDTAIELKGEAVWSLTVMFLTVWDYLRGETQPYHFYEPSYVDFKGVTDGYVQPFDDSPLDNERVGENVYLNMISRARQYVYITTPYLVIDNELLTALSLAAKSGVDVRITTPHIADKRWVHAVTRSYYKMLMDSGVRIYEYTPGFIHSKTFVSDDLYGVVGTINMDFRSLFLEFECAVWLYDTKSVIEIRDDYFETLEKCMEITTEALNEVKLGARITGQVLRVFSPLM